MERLFTRRAIAPALAVLALCAPAARGESQPHARAEPVRLLIVTLDTLRADRLGVYGHGAPTSPALDAFARTATVFEDVTCSMPTTLPSHLTLFTGLTPRQHGVTENGRVAEGEMTSIFELLAPRGARTAAVVAARVLEERYLAGLGIGEVRFGDGGSPKAFEVAADRVTAAAIDWLGAHGGEPFVLWLHYFDPHEPYAAPPGWAERFARGYDGPLAGPSKEWLAALNEEAFAATLSERDRRHVLDLYDAEVAFLDEELGRLFAFLEQRGLWRDTLIVVVGDHGQAHGEGGFWGHGERLLEPVIRVPFLVKLPRQAAGRRISASVETLDLVPTLAELFGLETPQGLAGRSLAGALSGEGEPAPGPPRIVERRSYSEAPERRGVALHAGGWKMTVYHEDGGARYHLGRRDGAGGLDGEDFYSPGAEELGLLRRLVAERGWRDATSRPFSEETLRMLRALGYVE